MKLTIEHAENPVYYIVSEPGDATHYEYYALHLREVVCFVNEYNEIKIPPRVPRFMLDGLRELFMPIKNTAKSEYEARRMFILHDTVIACATELNVNLWTLAEIVSSSTKCIGAAGPCGCLKCSPNMPPNMRFNVCPICGNKRCPHASDHNYECTNSNEVGQTGVYGDNDR